MASCSGEQPGIASKDRCQADILRLSRLRQNCYRECSIIAHATYVTMTFAHPCDKSFRRMLTSSNIAFTGCQHGCQCRRRNFDPGINLHCFVMDQASAEDSATPSRPKRWRNLRGKKGFKMSFCSPELLSHRSVIFRVVSP